MCDFDSDIVRSVKVPMSPNAKQERELECIEVKIVSPARV